MKIKRIKNISEDNARRRKMSNNLKGNPVEGFAEKSREAAVEGIVLLKNEGNVLPLTEDDKVSVFGRPMIEYYRSGTGSGGAVNVEYTTNILDGFENSNLNFNKTIVEDYKEWLKDHPFDNGGGGWACEPWFQKDMEITADYAKKQAESTNKAVYIIGRTAGEDKDNANWVGSYLLTDEEKENLKNITEAFEDVCVVLNVSNIIDLKWIDEEQFKGHIKSVIIVWQGGMEGGNAVAEALSGKATPSGKLPDTVAYDIEDYPANDNFGNELTNLYKEDIYVGYRYFETFAPEKVQFEFGFGLSYTTFDIETVSADADDEKTQAFVSAYKEAYGDTPNQFAADTYDAIYIMKAAAEKAGVTADMSVSDICDAMKTAMTEISYDGLTGEGMTWTADGEPDKAPKAVVIKDGVYTAM